MPEIPEEIIRDEEYYFSSADDLLIFRVENRLFKVHRFFLERESPVFKDTLSFIQPPGDDGKDVAKHEGGSDSRPIHIPDVTVPEFRTLLEMLYKPNYTYPTFSLEQWIALLSIADRFQITVDYARVMETLETSTPRLEEIEEIAIIAKYDLPMSYITPALVRLVMQTGPLTVDEMKRIPVEMIPRIYEAREAFLRITYRGRLQALNIVQNMFGPEK